MARPKGILSKATYYRLRFLEEAILENTYNNMNKTTREIAVEINKKLTSLGLSEINYRTLDTDLRSLQKEWALTNTKGVWTAEPYEDYDSLLDYIPFDPTKYDDDEYIRSLVDPKLYEQYIFRRKFGEECIVFQNKEKDFSEHTIKIIETIINKNVIKVYLKDKEYLLSPIMIKRTEKGDYLYGLNHYEETSDDYVVNSIVNDKIIMCIQIKQIENINIEDSIAFEADQELIDSVALLAKHTIGLQLTGGTVTNIFCWSKTNPKEIFQNITLYRFYNPRTWNENKWEEGFVFDLWANIDNDLINMMIANNIKTSHEELNRLIAERIKEQAEYYGLMVTDKKEDKKSSRLESQKKNEVIEDCKKQLDEIKYRLSSIQETGIV